MQGINKDSLSPAFLSLLVPGLGQLAQERNGIGFFQLAWGFLAVIFLFISDEIGIPTILPVLDVLAVTSWSVIDALVWRPDQTQS